MRKIETQGIYLKSQELCPSYKDMDEASLCLMSDNEKF